MPTLTIKNVPAHMIRSIELRAEKEHTTVRTVALRALAAHVGSETAESSVEAASEPMRKALAHIQGVFVQYERELLVARLRESREQTKAATGRCEGQKPYGHYKGEAAILAQIRSMRDSGMTHQAIAAKLDSRGISARSGGHWGRGTISKILRRAN